MLKASATDFADVEAHAMDTLCGRRWKPDYMAVRRRRDLHVPHACEQLVVLGAVRIGNTRLIDNVKV